MIILTASEFRKNLKKYLNLADIEPISVKSGNKIYDVTLNKSVHVNPSPSGDPFWDEPRNVEELNRSLAQLKADRESGRDKEYPTYTAGKFKERFGL